jgi:hypothetical protein
MVRFSDMLGGGEDPQAPPATVAPPADVPAPEALAAADPEPETEPEPEDESPEAVLDRLAQYAAEHSPEPETSSPETSSPETASPEPETSSPAPLASATPGDDLLPRGKRRKRR